MHVKVDQRLNDFSSDSRNSDVKTGESDAAGLLGVRIRPGSELSPFLQLQLHNR